jgi:putative ABC transport system permease protein
LFEVSAFDPLTFSVTVLVLIVAALAGSYIPARHATKVDPMDALRYE